MNIDRNEPDNYITGHYGEDQEQTDEPEDVEVIEMTPYAAVRAAIFDLCWKAREWEGRDDPHGVLPHIKSLIANLEQVQRDLSELRKIKAALAVLKEVT